MSASAVLVLALVHVHASLLVRSKDESREALAIERSDCVAAVVVATPVLRQAFVHV